MELQGRRRGERPQRVFMDVLKEDIQRTGAAEQDEMEADVPVKGAELNISTSFVKNSTDVSLLLLKVKF